MWALVWLVVGLVTILLIYILAEKGPLEDDNGSRT